MAGRLPCPMALRDRFANTRRATIISLTQTSKQNVRSPRNETWQRIVTVGPTWLTLNVWVEIDRWRCSHCKTRFTGRLCNFKPKTKIKLSVPWQSDGRGVDAEMSEQLVTHAAWACMCFSHVTFRHEKKTCCLTQSAKCQLSELQIAFDYLGILPMGLIFSGY